MARLTVEERVQREVAAAARRERAAVRVPGQWVGLSHAGAIAWCVAIAGLAAAVWRYTQGVATGAVATVLVTAWLVVAARWMAVPDEERARWYAVAAAVAATGLWLMDARGAGVSVVVLAVIGGVVWAALVAVRRRRLRRFAWAVTQLARASGDERALHLIMTPAPTESGLPARWYVPEQPVRRMVTDEDEDEEDDPSAPESVDWVSRGSFDPARVLGRELGVKVAVTVSHGIGVVTTADRSKLAAERKRYDAVLAKHIRGRVTVLERDEDGALQRLEFTWPAKMADRVTSAPYQARIVRTLQSQLGESLTARWNLPKATAILTPLPPLATRLPRPPRDLENPMKVAFGQQRGGVECIFDLDGTLPHIAIGGGTGAGKTVLARTLLLGLPRPAGSIVEVFPIDPKMIGFLGLDQLPGVRKPADNPKDIVDYLERVQAIMMRRYDALKARTVKRTELVPLVLLIDEGEEMADILNDWWASGEGKEDWQVRRNMEKKPSGTTHPAMKLYLGSILRLGRAAHVHVIAASQQFSTGWLATSSRSQFGIRIAVSNLEATTSEMLFGSRIATSGLDGTTPGRAWVSIGRGAVPVEAQIYWTPEIEEGLGDADREILHQLGVRLPDDPTDLVIPGEVPAEDRADLDDDIDDTDPDDVDDRADLDDVEPSPASAGEPADEIGAELLAEAATLVVRSQYASTAMLSRKMRVGHAVAVELIERLVLHDVVAATDSGVEVLLPAEALPALLDRLGERVVDQDEPVDVEVAADDVEELAGVETPVLDLVDGARIVVDLDGVPTVATVVDVAPDDVDEDYLALSYITDDEVSGVLSLADDELVTVLST